MPEYQGLRDCIEFQYPYARSVRRPMKFSVSELKHRAMEAAEQQEPEEGIRCSGQKAERIRKRIKMCSERGPCTMVLERSRLMKFEQNRTEEFFELLVKTGR